MSVNAQLLGMQIVDSEIVDATSQSSSFSVRREQNLEMEGVQGDLANDTNKDSAPDVSAKFRDLICQGSIACQDLVRATSVVAEWERRHDLIRKGLEREQKELARVCEEPVFTEPEQFLELAEVEDSVKLYTKRVEQCRANLADAQETCAEARERRSRLQEALFQLLRTLPKQILASLKLPAVFFLNYEHSAELRQSLKDTRIQHEKANTEAVAMKGVIEGLAANFDRTDDQVESVEAVAFYRQVGKFAYLQRVEEGLHKRLVEDERRLAEDHGTLCSEVIKALGLQVYDANDTPEESQEPDESTSQEQPRSQRVARVRMLEEQVAETDEKNRLANKRWGAHVQLHAEERKLEKLEQSYEDGLRQFKALKETSRTRSEFDRFCLMSTMNQLRQIRVAEEAYDAARIAARDIGVEPSESEESMFGSMDDGYRLSEEAELATFDRERVESWLEGVDQRSKGILLPVRPDDVEVLGPADQNNLLGLNDSVSVIAVQKRRVKIDWWREQTGTSKDRAEIESRQEQSVTSKRRRLE